MDLSVVPYGGEPVAGGAAAGEARYRECMRNHAAAMGGQAFDGCGEYMPSGGEGGGDGDELKCAACGCHRNFHRRDGGVDRHRRSSPPPPPPLLLYGAPWDRRKPAAVAPPGFSPFFPPPPQPHAMPMPYHQIPPPPPLQPCGSRDGSETPPPAPAAPPCGGAGGYDRRRGEEFGRKRFRTKFTAEQKERMREFAERLGWRIQKHDDAAMEEFCLEIGVKRHVLKVWMHNNKNSLSSSSPSSSSSIPNPNPNPSSDPSNPNQQQQHAPPIHV